MKETKAAAERDIAAVYKQSEELQEKARQQALKDIDAVRADGLKAIQENIDSWQNKLRDAQQKSEKEISDLVSLCSKLTESLGKLNKEAQSNRLIEQKYTQLLAASHRPVKKGIIAHLRLDITTPDELLFIEAAEALKKYNK